MSIPPKSGFIDISPQAEQTKLDPSGSKLKNASSSPRAATAQAPDTKSEHRRHDKDRTVSMPAVKGPTEHRENKKTREQTLVIESVPVEKEAEDDEEVIVKPIPIIEKSSNSLSKTPTVDEVLDEEDLPPKKRRGPSGGYYLECFLREVLSNFIKKKCQTCPWRNECSKDTRFFMNKEDCIELGVVYLQKPSGC